MNRKKIILVVFSTFIFASIFAYFYKRKKIYNEYKNSILTALHAVPQNSKNRCIMVDDVFLNLQCLRSQQLKDYQTEYEIIKILQSTDVKGYKELQHFTIMLSEFFKSYAKIFDKSKNNILLNMMMSDNPTQGGNIGKNIEDLNKLILQVDDFSPFKFGDSRPNHRELTQAILCNSGAWCKYIWLMVVGLVKNNRKVLQLIEENDINVENLKLRIDMVQKYMIEDINHIIGTLCDVSSIDKGIPNDACDIGPKGISDLKCDIFCTKGHANKTICSLMLKTFSFYKAIGKELDPELLLKYSTGYGKNMYKPEQFQKLKIDELLPPPSIRELKFWDTLPTYYDKQRVPWPNGMNVILTNPANPLVDLSSSRDDLAVSGTSGHAETILSIAVLFNRYKDQNLLKDLIRGMIVSICPHHHSIREVVTSAYPPPYNIDFNFKEDGPLNIIKNLL